MGCKLISTEIAPADPPLLPIVGAQVVSMNDRSTRQKRVFMIITIIIMTSTRSGRADRKVSGFIWQWDLL